MDRISKLPVLLLPWFAENKRDLPWRADRLPYHVWLSEIMLQQTRVEAVKGYYTRFLTALPDIPSLAQAEETLLLKLWEGLGYYSRVRNLQKAAREIVELGSFPTEYADILRLSGIGPYTAGAIASICFEAPAPAVDGNVIRVLSRLLCRTVERKEAEELLRPVYPEGHCGDFTQALMELGATVCVPNGAPHCENCPLKELCGAKSEDCQQCYPEKKAKKPRRIEERSVFFLRCGEKIALCKRPNKGLLAGLWQFPDVEGYLEAEKAIALAESWGVEPTAIEKTVERQHIFTHVEWHLRGIYLRCRKEAKFQWFTEEEIREHIGLPTAYRQFL